MAVSAHVCVLPSRRPLFPARLKWIKLTAPVLILFSVLQLELTLALCILCEWPPGSQILLFFFPFVCLWPTALLLHLLLCLLSSSFSPRWVSAGYCVAVQGAEMLLATGPRSKLTAGTVR